MHNLYFEVAVKKHALCVNPIYADFFHYQVMYAYFYPSIRYFIAFCVQISLFDIFAPDLFISR